MPEGGDINLRALEPISVQRRPLVSFVLCYMCGTALSLARSGAPYMLFIAWLAVGASIFALFRRRHRYVILGWAATVCVAWLIGAQHPLRSADNNHDLHFEPGERVGIEGVVADDPGYRVLHGDERLVWSFPLNLRSMRREGAPNQVSKGRIQVGWFAWADAAAPRYGEHWKFEGVIREQKGKPGTWRLNTDQDASSLLEPAKGNSFRSFCYEIRRESARCLALGLEDDPELQSLPLALLLGYREQLSWARRDLFAATGTLHIFAISGLHVGIFAGLIIFLLKLCGLPRGSWIFVLAPCLLMYAVATGARASAVRACVMAMVYFMAPALGRKADVPSGLAFSALVILLWNPGQLYDVGFIFSFTVVVGILIFYPSLLRLLEQGWAPDPFLAEPEAAQHGRLRNGLRTVGSLAALSVSAWLSSAPLTAYYFGRFTPIALLGNLVVIPLAFLSVLSGCLSLTLGSCCEFLAEVFNHANVALIGGLILAMRLMAAVPYGSMDVSQPPLWLVCAWYAALLGGGVWLAGFTASRTACKVACDAPNEA